MDRKRKSLVAKGKGKLAMPPTRKSPRLAGLRPSSPPFSPKSVLAIAAAKVETYPKAQESVQAPVVEPKPKKVEVIDLVSDEEEEAQEKEAAMEQPPLEDLNYEEKEEEDPEESVEPEEAPSSWSLLSPFPATPDLAPREYDDPHYWNYDGDLDQWGTNVAGGESAAAQDWDSTVEEKEDHSTSSTSTD
ncbi:hypothetical protein PIB30_035327 [Stylosanthes scabra]|uniref:Uncharacterized protein n=1 Tax=Stylosanthes scabra TaxID=79078 RepID=A0ABU6TEY1_9FABA|nr:hypothetical protein [Stylosanthes scabra]